MCRKKKCSMDTDRSTLVLQFVSQIERGNDYGHYWYVTATQFVLTVVFVWQESIERARALMEKHAWAQKSGGGDGQP